MAASTQPVKIDLGVICEALGEVETKWFKIGIRLGIPRSKLQEFKKDEDPLSAVVDYWLKGNVTNSVISWNSIVEVLKSKYVGEPGLGEEIRKEYCQCQSEDTAPSPDNGLSRQEPRADEDRQRVAPNNATVESSESSAPITQDKIDPDVRRELERILERNTKEIISKFASYVDCLRIAIRDKEVTVDDLRSYLLSVPATSLSYKGQKLTLLSDKEAQLQECKTITDVFNFLKTKCASFLNYDIFQFILKYYEICDNQEKLQYPEHLKAYIKKHKVSEFTRVNPFLKPKNSSKELTIKYDIETSCYLARVTDLKKLIADIMEISSLALEIVDIEDGCLIVKFSVSATLANALFTPDTVFTPQQEMELRASSVLWLKCNGLTFYFDKQRLQDEAFRKLLTCSLCLGTYTDPRQLLCQHAYCRECLAGLVQDQQGRCVLKCPTCRHITPIPPHGIAGLQADFRANQLLDFVKKDWSQSTLAHRPAAIIASSEKEVASQANGSHEKTSHYCPDHDGMAMEVFCDTCSVSICWKCSLKGGGHQYHVCEEINAAFARCKEDVLSLSKAIDQSLIKLDAHSEKTSNQQEAIREEILSTVELNDRKTELVIELDQLTQSKLKSLAAQRDQIEFTQAQLNSFFLFLRDTKSQGETLLMKSTTVKQVKELTATFQPGLFDAEADMIYLSLLDGTGECQVHSESSPNPSECFVRSEEAVAAEVGKMSTTLLQAVNFNNWHRKEVITFISCELVSAITGTRTRGSVLKKSQSQLNISYKPAIKGRHQLHIQVEGEHIRGSPFPVNVKSVVEDIGAPILTINDIKKPVGVAINSNREVVVVTERKGVFVFSPSGEKLRSFGKRGSGKGQLQRPSGLALDGEGNILVADRSNHRIQKFTHQGEFLKSVGSKGSNPLEFDSPCGIAFSASNDRVYVVDDSGCIQVLNSDLSYLDTFGWGKIKLKGPRHMACDSIGNLYVTEWGNRSIQAFTAEGEFLWVLEDEEGLQEPYGIAVDSSDRVYVSDWESNSVSMVTSEGQFVTSFGSQGNDQGEFDMPAGLAVSSSGVVYVCDLCNNRVQLF